MSEETRLIAARIRELREVFGCSVEEMARETGVAVRVYEGYESDGADIPISVLYHISHKFNVDLTEILTGRAARISTYCIVRAGKGERIDRYPGYTFQALAPTFTQKVMEPLMVTVEPEESDPALVTHPGQEFNIVLDGSVEVLYEGKRLLLGTGDSIYFDPARPHGQRCAGKTPARFLTVITEDGR